MSVVDDLNFQVEGAEAVAHAAAPLLAFKLRISGGGTATDGRELIQAIALRCQVRIEPTRRAYRPPEEEGRFDLFGETGQWSRTLRTSDFNVAAARVGKEMMDLYYPNTAWLCLRKDIFERLRRYRSGQGLASWEAALERLLEEAERPVAQ